MSRYSIGVDFGTESARAVVIDLENGEQCGTATAAYPNGVIDRLLPVDGEAVQLPADWALQDPHDYITCLGDSVRRALREADVEPESVVGLGVSFTSCTALPVDQDGLPLCANPEFRRRPHAWVKLWKHHAAQHEADEIDAAARAQQAGWLDRYGGRSSCEWFFPKLLQIHREAPQVYEATHRFVEAGDWLVTQLTGRQVGSACMAGYKAAWSADEGFPGADFWASVDSSFNPTAKLATDVLPVGGRAGRLTVQGASLTGLLPDTAVAPAIIDAHASVPGAGVTDAGTMALIMGTSLCHMLLNEQLVAVEGIAGAVQDGIIPGLVGYEAGQPALGDMFAWATRFTGRSFAELEAGAAELAPGESGLIALDWFNGNRSVLDDAALSGVVAGLTLSTTPAHLYRALMEAAALGTRVIAERFEQAGIQIDNLVACGGIARRSPLLLQIFADVLGRPLRLAAAKETSALGAAIYGAVAAGASTGGYDDVASATKALAGHVTRTIHPDHRHRYVYDQLFEDYRQLHDYFGHSQRQMMIALREGGGVEAA